MVRTGHIYILSSNGSEYHSDKIIIVIIIGDRITQATLVFTFRFLRSSTVH